MRELADHELTTLLQRAECIFCGQTKLYNGPQGGLMTNVFCDGCGAGYNLPPVNVPIGGQLINGPRDDLRSRDVAVFSEERG